MKNVIFIMANIYYLLIFACFDSNSQSICKKVAGDDFYDHLALSELKYGETEESKEKALKIVTECLNSNEICVVGARFDDNDVKVKIWSRNKIGEVFADKNMNEENIDVLFAVIQFTNKSQEQMCIAATRGLSRTLPWYVIGWKGAGGAVIRSDLTDYSSSYVGMPPDQLVDDLLQSYKYWKKKR